MLLLRNAKLLKLCQTANFLYKKVGDAGRGSAVTYPASVYQNRVSRKKVSIIPVTKNGWCLPFPVNRTKKCLLKSGKVNKNSTRPL